MEPTPVENSTQIWGPEERGCRGKKTRRRTLAAVVVACCVVIALGLGVALSGFSGSEEESVDRIVGQATDPNAIGCFKDERYNRVMTDMLRKLDMTPPASFLLFYFAFALLQELTTLYIVWQQ